MTYYESVVKNAALNTSAICKDTKCPFKEEDYRQWCDGWGDYVCESEIPEIVSNAYVEGMKAAKQSVERNKVKVNDYLSSLTEEQRESALELLDNGDCYLEFRGDQSCFWINCGSLFSWGCSDVEPLTPENFKEVADLCRLHNVWGPCIWVCYKRNLQPQIPVVKDMKTLGLWNDKLESLPSNPN